MKRDASAYVDDILESIGKIREYVHKMDLDDFEGNSQTQDAVMRRLEVIGEAVKQMPDTAKAVHPEIPWKQISGMRDVISHAYFGVNPRRIWAVIMGEMDDLEDAMRKIKKDFEKTSH